MLYCQKYTPTDCFFGDFTQLGYGSKIDKQLINSTNLPLKDFLQSLINPLSANVEYIQNGILYSVFRFCQSSEIWLKS